MLTATDGRDILDNTPSGWEHNQQWLWFTGPAGSDGSGGPWGNPPPNAYDARGILPAVNRCTSIIADTLGGLPWHIYRGWDQLATPNWIGDPQAMVQDGRVTARQIDNVKLSAVEFWTEWIVSALWTGNGYIWCPVRNADGSPGTPMWILNPSKVRIEAGQYFVADQLMMPGEIIHLRGEPPYKGGKGTGVFTRHGIDIGLAATVREYSAGQYNSGIPYGYIKSTAPRLDEDSAKGLKAKWLEQHGGARRTVAVLNSTTDFVPLALSPLDAQLDNARQWALRDIALAFNMPAYMLGVPGDSSTYANVESRMIELRSFTLLPWIRRIESTLDAQFPRGTELKIVTAGLERGDTMTRYNAYKIALDSQFMTRDEVRALENLPPLGAAADDSLPDELPVPLTTDAEPTDPPVSLVKGAA